MRLLVLTLEMPVFDDRVDEVVVPLADGWLGVRDRRAPFQARLLAGDVVVRAAGRERTLATLGGVVMVERDAVTILTGAGKVDVTLEALEHEIGDDLRRRRALEQQAKKHFDRVYHQVARAVAGRDGGGA